MHAAAPPLFDLAVRPERSNVLVTVEGELDMATAPRLTHAIDDLRDVGWDAIALDLSAASFVDSTGLRALLHAQAQARREGWRFELQGECEAFERLLSVTGLQDWFTRA
jgi:anti-sigma B factor antagonist